jgi:hypothetical protein
MYLGLGSLFCSAFTGVPAVILGATSLKEASPAGKTKAYVGIGVGGATSGLLMLGILASALVPRAAPTSSPVEASSAAAPASGAASPAQASQVRTAKADKPAADDSNSAVAAKPGTTGSSPQNAALVTKRAEACAKYKAESNEIRASKVFTEYLNSAEAAGYKVDNLSGTIEKIETTSGGGEAMIKVTTEIGTFGSNDIFQGNKRGIQKGSKVYAALADMSVGDSVIFSAKLVAPEKGFVEKAAVCGDDWVALFTSITKH